jgi:hypothetical protein
VDDANLEAVDQHQDGGSCVGSADADVVQPAVVAEAEFAAGVDDIVAEAWLGFGFGRDLWGCFRSGLVSSRGGAPVQ